MSWFQEKWAAQLGRGFFLARETMTVFGISRATLTRWNRAGYLNPFKRGGILIYRADDIVRILQEDMGLEIEERVMPKESRMSSALLP